MNRLTTLITAAFVLGVLLMFRMPAAADVDSQSVLSSMGVQVEETSLGDLVADAVRDAARAPVALVPAGSFREIMLSKGKVDPDDIAKCLQYPEDKIAVVDLTGNQLLAALERSLSIYPQKNMGFLQVSGLKMTFDPTSPKGSRITAVDIGNQKLDESRIYQVAMPAPLADGGNGFFTIWGKDKSRLTKATVSKAVSDFITSKTSVNYDDSNRINAK